jgi:NitT/TauT family transport system substrate-binding protein
MRRTSIVRLLATSFIVVPVLLNGCQSQPTGTSTPSASPSMSASSETQAKRSIKVNPSWLLQGDNAPLTMAIQKGYFSGKGLDVKIERGFGSADTLAKVASGQFEIGFGDLYSMIEFNAKNPNDQLIAVALPYNKSPFSIVSLKKNSINDVKALEGKKLGAPAGDAPRKVFPVLSQQVGIKADGVEWVTMEPKLREAFLIKGDVDAISGFITTIVPSLAKAGTKAEDLNIFYYTDNGLDLYGNAIIVKKSFLKQNPEVVKNFLAAYVQGFQDMIKDPNSGLESVVKAGDSLMDPNSEKLRLQIALEKLYITPEVDQVGIGGADLGRLEKTIQQVSKGFGLEVPKVDQVFDGSFLPSKEKRILPSAADRKPLS